MTLPKYCIRSLNIPGHQMKLGKDIPLYSPHPRFLQTVIAISKNTHHELTLCEACVGVYHTDSSTKVKYVYISVLLFLVGPLTVLLEVDL